MKHRKKIVFLASSGGHLTQLLQLQALFSEYDSYVITESDISTSDLEDRINHSAKVLYLPPTRKDNRFGYIKGNIVSLLLSVKYFFSINPDVVISTGAGISVYMCYLAKLFLRKIIFIETFAALKGKSGAGKLIYPIADRFYIQWKSMAKFYPKALYRGTLY